MELKKICYNLVLLEPKYNLFKIQLESASHDFTYLNIHNWNSWENCRCAKNVQIRSFCGLYFPVFGLNMDNWARPENFDVCFLVRLYHYFGKLMSEGEIADELTCFQTQLWNFSCFSSFCEVLSLNPNKISIFEGGFSGRRAVNLTSLSYFQKKKK